MIRNTQQIFDDLDKHASEFNFPVLDNEYVEFAAARLNAFQNSNDWLVVFEVLGFSTREVEFVNNLYAFGSCVEREGFVGEEIPVRSVPKQPLFDPETNECIADWTHWAVQVGTEELSFSPAREDYTEAGILINREPGRGSLSEIELLRFLVHHLGATRFFLTDEAILNNFPKCINLKQFIKATQWQHPNVAEGEKPSENVSICSLVEALSHKDQALFNQGNPNTYWMFWASAT
jgi:hypothetical protein